MKRIYAAVALLLFCSCAKNSSPTDSGGGTAAIVGDDYVTGTFGSTSVVMNPQPNNGQAGTFEEYSGNFYYVQGYKFIYYDTRGKPVAGKPAVSVYFAKQFTTYADQTDYAGIVYKGTMPFANRAKRIDGAAIEYTDASGHFWSTDNGSGDQTGSLFTIASNDSVVYNYPPYPHFRSKGTFNCTLYDSVNNSMRVTGGRFGVYSLYHQ